MSDEPRGGGDDKPRPSLQERLQAGRTESAAPGPAPVRTRPRSAPTSGVAARPTPEPDDDDDDDDEDDFVEEIASQLRKKWLLWGTCAGVAIFTIGFGIGVGAEALIAHIPSGDVRETLVLLLGFMSTVLLAVISAVSPQGTMVMPRDTSRHRRVSRGRQRARYSPSRRMNSQIGRRRSQFGRDE